MPIFRDHMIIVLEWPGQISHDFPAVEEKYLGRVEHLSWKKEVSRQRGSSHVEKERSLCGESNVSWM